jgi:hypothetical protein
MGWFTVWAYGLTAVLAGWTAKRTGADRVIEDGPKVKTVWIAVTLLLAFLCVNKQLDLQSLVTDIGRALAKTQGWYGERREVQRLFVLGVLTAAGAFAAWFTWRFRYFWLHHGLLVTGLFFLLTFIAVRAVSFHHVDQFLKTRFSGVKMNWVLELTGIFLVAAAAVREMWRGRTDTPE